MAHIETPWVEETAARMERTGLAFEIKMVKAQSANNRTSCLLMGQGVSSFLDLV